jgi:osmoprotectant transport system permease protein
VTSRGTAVALALAVAALLVAVARESRAGSPLRVGSKRFTESYILAEIAVQTARAHGEPTAVHVQGLGATAIAFKALEDGEIDLYPDYTGTIAETLFHGDAAVDAATLASALAARGLGILGPLGFENTYALAVRADFVKGGDATISGLKRRGHLLVGVSHEFLGRSDGWPGLAARYGLVPREVRAMDHGLAYAALVAGQVDVVDAYSTDAKIAKYGLVLLGDDRRFFPSYEATFLYRRDAEAAHPEAFAALSGLRSAIGADAMRAMNGQAELDGRSFADVASGFLAGQVSGPAGAANQRSFLARLGRSIVRYGPRHVALTAIALAFATVVGILFGIVGARRPLLCLFIPLFGIGVVPTLVALFVYGLLPITRNTLTALNEIPAPTRESAEALGLTPWETLRVIELPLASRSILAGIKTSAVLTVGTATVAAFIGAGGFGEPISVGLNLNDMPMILEGAIPAALLALLVQGLFALVDRAVVPRGLQVATARTESGRARAVG